MNRRNAEKTTLNGVPSRSAAPDVNTASSARMHIWATTMLRVRPSSPPCSSTYSEPLIHANQIKPNMIANSTTPRAEMSCAS